MAGYFFRYVAPKIAKNLTQRRKAKDEAFKSIDEKGKGLSLQKRSQIKKSFSGKASKIFDDASKKRKEFKKGSSKGKVPTTSKEKAFGMLSVKAKRDNNPNITLTDKIVGAKKT